MFGTGSPDVIAKPVQVTEAAQKLGEALRHSLPPQPWRTRFAPAPTGFLHLGHVVSAIHVWGVARAFGGSVALRIEDHDTQRCRSEFEHAILDDLDWLGFVPDIGATAEFRRGAHSHRQSDHQLRFEHALNALAAKDQLYACTCSRREIRTVALLSASGELRYPGTCNDRNFAAATKARRFRVDSSTEHFEDLRLGKQRQMPAEQCGDFLVCDRLGQYTYQFSVAVDDMVQGIDVVIRGEDLLASTGRQLQLARALERETAPLFLHHRLLYRPDGLKLSKSLGDNGVGQMRLAGLSAADVIGRAAFEAGLIVHPVPVSQSELPALFQSETGASASLL